MVASLVPCLVCGDMGLCATCQATLPPPAEGLHLERTRGAAVSVLVCTKGHRTEVSTAATRSNPPRACPVCVDLAPRVALLVVRFRRRAQGRDVETTYAVPWDAVCGMASIGPDDVRPWACSPRGVYLERWTER